MSNKFYLSVCLLCLFSGLALPSFGDERSGPSELPREISDTFNRGKTGLGDLISDEIFDSIGDIDVYQVKFSDFEGQIRMGRKVLANHDIEESYTVIDRVQMPVYLPVLSVPLGTEVVTFNIGLGSGLDFANIRVVKPSGALSRERLLESLEQKTDLVERKAELESSDWYEEAKKTFGSADAPYVDGSDGSEDKPVYLMDSLRRARYGKLWNMVSGPLALPFKASWLSHFTPNEVTTYGGYGSVEIGVSAGYVTNISSGFFEQLGLTAGVRAYLRGNFQISVKKSGTDKVKVKLMRRNDKGVGGSAGIHLPVNVYDGFLLAGSIFGQNFNVNVGKIRESLIPISFTADKVWGKGFEIGYEYDLKDDRAIEAYEQAVLGRFALSEELSVLPESPVKNIFRKEFTRKTTSREVTVSLQLINHKGTSIFAIEDAVVQFPDGKSHVYKATSQVMARNEADFWILKLNEQISYTVHADFIEALTGVPQTQAQGAGKLALLGMIVEGQIEDNYTGGDELNRYSEMLEHLFGIENMFPKVPEYIKIVSKRMPCYAGDECRGVEPEGEDESWQFTHYGRSQYYFRISFTEAQLVKFLLTPREKMWADLERGFERRPGVWKNVTSRRMLSASFGWFGDLLAWAFQIKDIDRGFGFKFHRASVFKKKWEKLQQLVEAGRDDQGSITLTAAQKLKLAKGIGEMFSDRAFTYELLNTTMFALREVNEKEISYQINAQSAAFPSLNLRGGDITEIEKASQKYEDETNFEIPRIRQDVTLGVTSLKIKQTAKLEFQVDYLAVRNPPLVMIRLDEVSSFLRTQRTLRRMMIPNRGQFHEGANTFIIKPSSIPGFEAELASAIRPGKNYRLTIALMDEANAGMPESEDFYVNPNF